MNENVLPANLLLSWVPDWPVVYQLQVIIITHCAAGTELLHEIKLLALCFPPVESCCALLEPNRCRKIGCWNPAAILLCAAGAELLHEIGLLEPCCPLLESFCALLESGRALLEPSCSIKIGRWNLTPFGLFKI